MTKKQKAFEYLKRVKKATLMEISEAIGMTFAGGSLIADLRKLGCIVTKKFLYTTKSGSPVWQYELLSWPEKLYVK